MTLATLYLGNLPDPGQVASIGSFMGISRVDSGHGFLSLAQTL